MENYNGNYEPYRHQTHIVSRGETMSMDTQALKSMGKMITAMLPYEPSYEPQKTSTRALHEIMDVLRKNNVKLDEFLGFINFVFKNMDAKGDSDQYDRTLMEIWAIINKHYPHLENEGHSLQVNVPPSVETEDEESRLSEDDPAYIRPEWRPFDHGQCM